MCFGREAGNLAQQLPASAGGCLSPEGQTFHCMAVGAWPYGAVPTHHFVPSEQHRAPVQPLCKLGPPSNPGTGALSPSSWCNPLSQHLRCPQIVFGVLWDMGHSWLIGGFGSKGLFSPMLAFPGYIPCPHPAACRDCLKLHCLP